MITTEQVFHIYDKNNEVIAHNLTVEEMEKIISKPGWFTEKKKNQYDVEVLEVASDREEHSY